MIPNTKKEKVPLDEKEENELFFNPRESRRIIRILCCLDYFQSPPLLKYLNLVYIFLVYSLQLIVILQGLIYLFATGNISDKVEAIHYTLVIVIITGYITNELINYSKLNQAWQILIFAYNNFNGHIIREEQKKVHRQNSKMVRILNKGFSCLMLLSCVGYLSFAPMREALSEEEGAPRSLPIPMYMPFDTTKKPGYGAALTWEGLTLFYLCGVATSAHQSYIGYMGGLRSELELLNYSICQTEERAIVKYGRKEITQETYKQTEFQNCLDECLKEDIKHHYLLLKYYHLTKFYLGFILLLFIVVASIILAAAGYLLTRPNSPMDATIKFVIIVCAEMTFVFQLCWYGEQVADESGKVFRNLFQGPWCQCSRTYRESLALCLAGTLRPIQLKTVLFNINASLVTYNSVVTTSFQYFNILRNIQSL